MLIIFKRPDGGVSVVHPAPQGRHDGEGEQEWLARVAARAVPEGAPFRLVKPEDLPPYDSATRNLWRWTDSGPLGMAAPEPAIAAPRPQISAGGAEIDTLKSEVAALKAAVAGMLDAIKAADQRGPA